jgi:hypothetical protein
MFPAAAARFFDESIGMDRDKPNIRVTRAI